jgi:hypothetical protein
MVKLTLSAFSTAYNFSVYVAFNSDFRHGVLRLMGYPNHCRCLRSRVVPTTTSDIAVTRIAMPRQTTGTGTQPDDLYS